MNRTGELTVCCYINALGKVLCKGLKGDGTRFRTFVLVCMQDFLLAQSTQALPPTPRGKVGGEHWLYEVYRCGFVHAYYPRAGAWCRSSSARYWLSSRGRPVLNIDRLVRGFEDGVVEFRQRAALDPDLRKNFGAYVSAGD